MTAEPRCLLTVHAHPDDEASKGPSTVAKYHDAGVRTVLVCCTGGEEGDILNPAMENADVRSRLADVRREELERATKIIGYDEVVMLGYRDSGMPDTEANARPDAFANADIDEATGRLVAVIRRERPQVVVTYNDDQTGYPHPDHLRVHDISVLAWSRAGDPAWYPDAGPPWEISKLYYTVWSRARIEKMHEAFLRLGLESPFNDDWFKNRPSHDDRVTTTVSVGDYYEVRKQALLAHATQVDPESPFWFGLPDDVLREVHPFDDYILAESRVPTELPEDDIFLGI